jgi:transposase-like protein
VLQELLEAEMTEHVGAAPYQRTTERKGQRNGHKPRTLRTRVGTLNLLAFLRTLRRNVLDAVVLALPAQREGFGVVGADGNVRGGDLHARRAIVDASARPTA